MAHTPGLWRHVTRPVQFTLVVDDFGIKYVGQDNLDHLIKAIEGAGYQVAVDEEGSLYCGIPFKWNYEQRYVYISMPWYVAKMIACFKHEAPKQAQHRPYQPEPRKYGKESQDTIPIDDTYKVSEPRVKVIQQVVGGALYYA